MYFLLIQISFSVFTSPLLEGDPKTALEKPNSIVLNKSAALKYFGISSGILGKTLEIEDRPYTITGLVADWPDHAHFSFNMLISTNTIFTKCTKELYQFFRSYLFITVKKIPMRQTWKLSYRK